MNLRNIVALNSLGDWQLTCGCLTEIYCLHMLFLSFQSHGTAASVEVGRIREDRKHNKLEQSVGCTPGGRVNECVQG